MCRKGESKHLIGRLLGKQHCCSLTLVVDSCVGKCRKGESKDLIGRLLGDAVKCYTTPCVQARRGRVCLLGAAAAGMAAV